MTERWVSGATESPDPDRCARDKRQGRMGAELAEPLRCDEVAWLDADLTADESDRVQG